MVCIIMWISHECLKKLRDFELKSFLENLRISKKVPTREFHGISRRVKTVKSFHWHPIWQWSQKSILGLLSNRSDRERDARIQSLNSNERIYYVHYVQLNISVRTSHTVYTRQVDFAGYSEVILNWPISADHAIRQRIIVRHSNLTEAKDLQWSAFKWCSWWHSPTLETF